MPALALSIIALPHPRNRPTCSIETLLLVQEYPSTRRPRTNLASTMEPNHNHVNQGAIGRGGGTNTEIFNYLASKNRPQRLSGRIPSSCNTLRLCAALCFFSRLPFSLPPAADLQALEALASASAEVLEARVAPVAPVERVVPVVAAQTLVQPHLERVSRLPRMLAPMAHGAMRICILVAVVTAWVVVFPRDALQGWIKPAMPYCR